MAQEQNYKAIAAIAQKRREEALPKEFFLPQDRLSKLPKDLTTLSQDTSIYTHDEIQIINAEAEEILQKVQSKIWTSVEVTQAFIKSATIAHQLTNCLTEILFTEALQTAKYLDDFLARTGKPIGPLHGLPVSLKDNFITPPHSSSIGLAGYANGSTKPEEESVLVTILKSLGAVLFVKTNVPVAMMMMETDNHIWGPTKNAVHSGCNAGGSSGGEAALIAMRGSPIGIGTDIGGSIRIPAAFQGLYGLKPSYSRYPQWGGRTGIPGNEFVLAVNGPISRSLSSLRAYSTAVLSSLPAASPWLKDPKCIPLTWRSNPQIQPPGRKLRLALVGPSDGLVTAHPPIERALNLTRKAVEAAGHEVIDWPVADTHPDIVKRTVAAFLDFGGPPILEILQRHGEPVFPAMKAYEAAVDAAGGQDQKMTTTHLRELNIARNAATKAYLDRWEATADAAAGKAPIDGIIMATTPWAAVRNGFTNSPPAGRPYFGFTAVWSLMDMPACTFPVLKVDKSVDKKRGAEFQPLGDLDQAIQDDYDPAFYDGAPVALQLVGRRLDEEKVLEVVERIEDALQAAGVVYKS